MTEFTEESIRNRKPHYERIYLYGPGPFRMYKKGDYILDRGIPFWWNIRPINWLFRFIDSFSGWLLSDYLFDRTHWLRGCSSSFPDTLYRVWNNMNIFLTPWYGIRRKFIQCFYAENDSKLLDCNYCSAYVRNREEECAYYSLEFIGFRYKLVKEIIRDKDGKPANGYISGLAIAFNEQLSDEEKQEAVNEFKTEKSVIRRGWVFTIKQAAHEINEIVKITSDLEWFLDDSEDLEDEQ